MQKPKGGENAKQKIQNKMKEILEQDTKRLELPFAKYSSWGPMVRKIFQNARTDITMSYRSSPSSLTILIQLLLSHRHQHIYSKIMPAPKKPATAMYAATAI